MESEGGVTNKDSKASAAHKNDALNYMPFIHLHIKIGFTYLAQL